MNTQPLKGTGRRMLAFFPGRIGCADHVSQVGGTGKWLFFTSLHNRLRHATGKALLTVFFEHAGNLFNRSLRQPLCCSDTHIRIHPHVQRTVMAETEAARCIIQLRRGNTKVQQNTINFASQPPLFELFAHVCETALHNRKAVIFLRQHCTCSYSFRVFVKAQQKARLPQLLQDLPAVATTTKSAIYIVATVTHLQGLYGLIQQNADVLVFAAHDQSTRLRSSSGMSFCCTKLMSCSHCACHCSSSQT